MSALGLAEDTPADRPRSASGRAISLLLFEAAGCLMALPSAEVVQIAVSARDLVGPANASGSLPLIDLSMHFAAPADAGFWIEWQRGDRTGGLRVARVLDVVFAELRTLRPMPAWLCAARSTGPFWGVGRDEEEIFLLLDPAKLPW